MVSSRYDGQCVLGNGIFGILVLLKHNTLSHLLIGGDELGLIGYITDKLSVVLYRQGKGKIAVNCDGEQQYGNTAYRCCIVECTGSGITAKLYTTAEGFAEQFAVIAGFLGFPQLFSKFQRPVEAFCKGFSGTFQRGLGTGQNASPAQYRSHKNIDRAVSLQIVRKDSMSI